MGGYSGRGSGGNSQPNTVQISKDDFINFSLFEKLIMKIFIITDKEKKLAQEYNKQHSLIEYYAIIEKSKYKKYF